MGSRTQRELTPERELYYQRQVDRLNEQIVDLTKERDAAVARILEVEEGYTEVVNDYEADINRLQTRVDRLERERRLRRLHLRTAGQVVVAALRAITNFIVRRYVHV